MNSDFSEFPALSELTVESCDYFSSFDCKESCGLCKLCDLVPGGSKRPECSTLCASGIDTCNSVCQAGQARCANAAQLSSTPAPKAVPVSQEVATEFTIESCNYFSKFDCKETCGLCRFCDVPGFDKTRSDAQPIVSVVLTHVPKLVMLAKQDVWNSFHQFLIYQLQLMRKYII